MQLVSLCFILRSLLPLSGDRAKDPNNYTTPAPPSPPVQNIYISLPVWEALDLNWWWWEGPTPSVLNQLWLGGGFITAGSKTVVMSASTVGDGFSSPSVCFLNRPRDHHCRFVLESVAGSRNKPAVMSTITNSLNRRWRTFPHNKYLYNNIASVYIIEAAEFNKIVRRLNERVHPPRLKQRVHVPNILQYLIRTIRSMHYT